MPPCLGREGVTGATGPLDKHVGGGSVYAGGRALRDGPRKEASVSLAPGSVHEFSFFFKIN